MRPPGDVRRMLRDAAWALALDRAGQSGLPWPEIARRASLQPCDRVRRTIDRMASEGEFLRAGRQPVGGAGRPMTTYLPAAPAARSTDAAPVEAVLRSWHQR